MIRIERKPGDMYYYKLTGYNTDYTGFKNSLNPILKADVHRKALILGTGGASKAVAQALKDLNIDWTYVSRSKGDNRLTYNELTSAIILDHKLIVNASPVGTFPDVDNCPDIPYQYLTTGHLLYDLVYNPETTLFLKKGGERAGGGSY